jgi:hypothetical protein
MSDRSINIDGTQYIRSRDAARCVHLTPDYVSRLSRGGLIEGRIVAGLWFVTLPSLQKVITDQERAAGSHRAPAVADHRGRRGRNIPSTKNQLLRNSSNPLTIPIIALRNIFRECQAALSLPFYVIVR